MKKVIVEINGKKSGPYEVYSERTIDDFIRIGVDFEPFIEDLKELGAKITEVREPLRWEGPVVINGVGDLLVNNHEKMGFTSWPDEMRCKRFKATLEEIVE